MDRGVTGLGRAERVKTRVTCRSVCGDELGDRSNTRPALDEVSFCSKANSQSLVPGSGLGLGIYALRELTWPEPLGPEYSRDLEEPSC